MRSWHPNTTYVVGPGVDDVGHRAERRVANLAYRQSTLKYETGNAAVRGALNGAEDGGVVMSFMWNLVSILLIIVLLVLWCF